MKVYILYNACGDYPERIEGLSLYKEKLEKLISEMIENQYYHDIIRDDFYIKEKELL